MANTKKKEAGAAAVADKSWVEAALRTWGEYQRVKADAAEAGRRRTASCHVGAVAWGGARMGHVSAVAFQVDRAMGMLENAEREALRLSYAESWPIDKVWESCGGGMMGRDRFRRWLRNDLVMRMGVLLVKAEN